MHFHFETESKADPPNTSAINAEAIHGASSQSYSAPPPNLMSMSMNNQQTGSNTDLDLSRPPPGFADNNSTQTTQEGPAALTVVPLMPSFEMPYYKLPAGLIIEFVKWDDFDYEPLDPSLIKLPHLQAPSDKLLKSVEEFYNIVGKTRNA